MNSDMYPNSGYDVPICFVYLNFFTKNIFPSRMIIGDQYESPHHQFSIQICLKKKNAVHIKTPSIPILTQIFSQLHRNTRKTHFKILAFSVYNVPCKMTPCKTSKKVRLAPQKILGFDQNCLIYSEKFVFVTF